MWLQVSPMEWKPSKEEMKKADMMDPGHEPEGIMEVILLLPYLLYNAALTLFSVVYAAGPTYNVSLGLLPILTHALHESCDARFAQG